jgi:putative transposase
MKHGERKSLRAKQHDYSSDASYYITICVDRHRCLFGTIENGSMVLNDFGHIAQEVWDKLPQRFPGLVLNAFVIMPNHIHCIITYTKISSVYTEGEALAATHTGKNTTISGIIGAYKSLVFVQILRIIKSKIPEIQLGKLWQRSFYDRIIHDSESYTHYVNYINDNPKNWKNDPFIK